MGRRWLALAVSVAAGSCGYPPLPALGLPDDAAGDAVADAGALCGNGAMDPGEDCDFGSANSDTGACTTSCKRAICGDGLVQMGVEVCDDGNSMGCGTCSADCRTVTSAAAVGTLTASSGMTTPAHGTFTVSDGTHPAVTFEFLIDQEPPAGIVKIGFHIPDTANTVAFGITDAFSFAPMLSIKATQSGNVVQLTNLRKTSIGNVAIASSISAGLTIQGMSGGLGGNCPEGVGCVSNDDCASNRCVMATHLCF